ncbi:acyl-CoA dehydrogenase family protein [Pararhodobacter sp.]|uniref:acyl-CoA dehydrogenase family protein n=1 Tax=Pararhodobacter sp. TaxID=2127056 RepID=UPI002AFE084A|nr:acyl-CoA dehydrogenase family protein [Pararhodobacter sp.]
MDLTYTAEDRAFRDDVRAFLKAKLPAEIAEKVASGEELTKADMDLWHTRLNEQGYLGGAWPKKFGGAQWSAVQKHIFEEECAFAHAPRIVPFGVSMLAPVLQAFGSKEQQDYYLPRILSGEDWWCQGYSEPGAGSDLASLKTRAVRDGDHYIVNGQKTWTTLGQHANKIFCLVRTSTEGKPQQGISFLLIDMDTPGIEVRPITLIDGVQEVNEVWFTDVRVPVENLVGEENKGWTYAKYLLTHERTGIAGVGYANAALAALKEIARTELNHGRPLIEDPQFAARLARIEIDLMAMATTNLRVVAGADSGAAPGAESSMLKVKGSILRQQINDLARRAVGPRAVPFVPAGLDSNLYHPGPEHAAKAANTYLNNRKISIYGGSNEVQRGIITKAILGL